MKNNDKSLNAKCYQLYQMSLKKLEGADPDLADEVIVSLWKQAEKLHKERLDFIKQIAELGKSVAEYSFKQDILESKIAILTGSKSLNTTEVHN